VKHLITALSVIFIVVGSVFNVAYGGPVQTMHVLGLTAVGFGMGMLNAVLLFKLLPGGTR
jgi:hypothetical protein